MKTPKQFCSTTTGMFLLASCVLMGQARASQITLSCADPNARAVYLEGTPGSNQCTIFNQTQSQLELVLVARDDAAATQAQIVKVDGEADDFAGNPTFNFGSCATGGIPASHVVDKAHVDGQCTFTVNFVTDEPGAPGAPPETGTEDTDKTTWRLDVFVHADKSPGQLVNTASASALIVVGDAGTVPEPTSFALVAIGCLLLLVSRVYSSRSTTAGSVRLARHAGTKQASSEPHTSSDAIPT
jgi:hypothetical protein